MIHSNQNDINEIRGITDDSQTMDDNQEIISKTKNKSFQNINTLNFQEQLLVSDFKRSHFFLNILLFSLYNINISHYSFYTLVHTIDFVPTIIIFFIIFIGCYFLSRELYKILAKAKSLSFCLYLEENFGSLSSYLYEIVSVFWVGMFFTMAFYIIKITFPGMKSSFWLKFGISLGFYVLMIVINMFDSFWIFICNLLITLFSTLCSMSCMIIKIIKNIQNNPNILNQNNDSKVINIYNNIFSGINVCYASFNMFIVFFLVNHNFTKTNIQIQKRTKIFLGGYIFQLIYYFIFIFYPFTENINNNADEENLISHLQENINKVENKILIICFIVDQILKANFYLSTLKQVIFKSNLKRVLDNKRFFILLTVVIFLSITIAYFIKSSNDIVEIGNATLGLLINLIIPGFILLKSNFSIKSILLLIFIIIIQVANTVSFQKKFFSILGLK